MKSEQSRPPAPESVLEKVRENFGADRAELYGDDRFRVESEAARVVALPNSAEELAEMLRLASAESWRIIPAGAGTWLGIGNPSNGFELIVSTLRLDRVVEYEPADLTATVGAGLSLASFNGMAGAHGQWIPLDPFGDPASTIGATVSTGSYGPLRGSFGTPRDWLIGIQVAHIDGRLTRAGGKVVKNVAGYDLCKLYTGSYGTLAIITEMNFKLRSIAPAERTLIFQSGQIEDLAALSDRLRQSAVLQPAAMEIISPSESPVPPLDPLSWALVIRFMHEPEAVDSQIAEARRIGAGVGSTDLSEDESTAFWRLYHQSETDPRWTTCLRISSLPASLAELFAGAIRELPGTEMRAHAANGVVRLLLAREPQTEESIIDLSQKLTRLRESLESRGGRMVLTRAAGLRGKIDAWGGAGATAPLMLAIKKSYDPDRLLNPDRFVNGI